MIVRAWGLLTERGNMRSAEGRALERRRRVLLSALSAGGAKAVSLMTLLVTVPLSLAYLGPERYGLWMAITGMLAVLSFADLGLGYGLVNTLSTTEGRSDPDGSRRAVSSAFYMLAGIGALLGVGLLLAWPHLHWGEWLNARSPATRREASAAMAVFSACFVLGLPLSVVTHGFYGLQQGFRSSLYQAIGSLLSLGGILAALKSGAGLPWLVLAGSGAPLLAGLLGGWDLFLHRRPDLRPRLAQASRQGALDLAHLGGLFFVIQAAMAIAFQSDSLVLSRLIGPESVAVYNVTQKLFLQVPFVLGFFLTPLWPAYAEAVARGDLPWVKRMLNRSVALGLAVNVPTAVLLYFAAPTILSWWVKGGVQAPPMLLAALATWAALNSFNGPLGMFLNGAGALRYQAISCGLMAVTNLALSIYLTRRVGIAGVVLGSIVAQTLFCYLPALIYVPSLIRRMERA